MAGVTMPLGLGSVKAYNWMINSAGGGDIMDWVRILAYITGTVDQELLLRNSELAEQRGQDGEGDSMHAGIVR